MIKNVTYILISIFLSLIFYSAAFAQLNTFDEEFLSGFSKDGRIKLLFLKLSLSTGQISESSIERIEDAIQKNLFNTNHFTVVGPEEMKAYMQSQEDSSEIECEDIACGIKIGKELRADKVMVSQIREERIQDENSGEEPEFTVSIRLLDVMTNSLDFSDEILFTDGTMQDQLFELATRISNNTLLRGRILSVNRDNVSLDLGKTHGLKMRDRFVIYTQTSIRDLEEQNLGLEQKNIAIAEINRLNDTSADAIILYRYEAPEPGALVKTFVNRHKQVELVEETRRELDTRKRLTRPTRPLVLEPEVIDTVTGEPVKEDKIKWQRRLAAAQSDLRRWMFIGIGAGVGMAILLTKRIDLGNFHQAAVVGGGIASGYIAYKYFQTRNNINALQAEGRVKKHISLQYRFGISPQGINVALSYKF